MVVEVVVEVEVLVVVVVEVVVEGILMAVRNFTEATLRACQQQRGVKRSPHIGYRAEMGGAMNGTTQVVSSTQSGSESELVRITSGPGAAVDEIHPMQHQASSD